MITGDDVTRIGPAHQRWPPGLDRLGRDRPPWLDLLGNTDLLSQAGTALFCSVRVPGRLVVDCYDLAQALADSGETFIGGFQSPLEREIFDRLLCGTANVILVLGRALAGARLRPVWRTPLEASRLLLLSPFGSGLRRPDARHCEARNRVCAALASRCIIVHASAGGRVARLALELSRWRLPLRCPAHPANEDLTLIGALPLPGWPGCGGPADGCVHRTTRR